MAQAIASAEDDQGSPPETAWMEHWYTAESSSVTPTSSEVELVATDHTKPPALPANAGPDVAPSADPEIELDPSELRVVRPNLVPLVLGVAAAALVGVLAIGGLLHGREASPSTLAAPSPRMWHAPDHLAGTPTSLPAPTAPPTSITPPTPTVVTATASTPPPSRVEAHPPAAKPRMTQARAANEGTRAPAHPKKITKPAKKAKTAKT